MKCPSCGKDLTDKGKDRQTSGMDVNVFSYAARAIHKYICEHDGTEVIVPLTKWHQIER